MSTNNDYQVFHLSNEINDFVTIIINSMDGDIDYTKIGMPEFPKTKPNQVYIGATLIANGNPIQLEEERTPTRDYISKAEWNEKIVFPIQYKDLEADSMVIFRVYCYHIEKGYIPLGDAVLPLINGDKGNILRKGTKRVKVEHCKYVNDNIHFNVNEYERHRLQNIMLDEKDERINTKKNALERAEKYQTKMLTATGKE